MLRTMLTAKIHRAIVTAAALNYQGSLTLGTALIEAAGLRVHEFVHITNINNGVHWVTYVMEDADNPGTVCMNGTAARHFLPGDPVIILAYGLFDDRDLATYHPRLVYVDEKNRVLRVEKP
jgi:aspartate 1-decarboxylase